MKTENFLKQYLIDMYAVLLKTQNFHWNVSGTRFYDLHLMFEEQYNDLFKSIDIVAERIRALGDSVSGGLIGYANMTSINDPEDKISADEMIRTLIADHKQLRNRAVNDIRICTQKGDDATAEILISRIQQHEKFIWMMNSVIDDEDSDTPSSHKHKSTPAKTGDKTLFQNSALFHNQRREVHER